MAYFVCDEDRPREFSNLPEALEYANQCIDCAREYCDPEWPDWTESISIYEAPSGCEYPDEDGKLVARAAEFDVRQAKDGDGCDYWCDYRIEVLE